MCTRVTEGLNHCMEVVEGWDLHKVSKRPPLTPKGTRCLGCGWAQGSDLLQVATLSINDARGPSPTSGLLMLQGREHRAALGHSPPGPGTRIPLWGRNRTTPEHGRFYQPVDLCSESTETKEKTGRRFETKLMEDFGGQLGNLGAGLL